MSQNAALYIGLMSGTSMDGVDGVLCTFPADRSPPIHILCSVFLPFSAEFREELLALQPVGENELHRSAVLSNRLSELYAEVVHRLLQGTQFAADAIRAIGCHGQTIRHHPAQGYSLQIGNHARLAELTGIDVIGDFRARDVAAGGQGAPLVPAFHHAMFATPDTRTTLANIGGMANLTRLHPDTPVTGFDCGPGNVLMDAWVQRHLNQPFDENGLWAASGQVIPNLLEALLSHPFFSQQPPKSCGREDFDLPWLETQISDDVTPADIQATLLELTAQSLTDALHHHCPATQRLLLCGGGTRNSRLCKRIAALLPDCEVTTTKSAGLPASLVEAAAFAWLAHRYDARLPGNLPSVTGASGLRVLGCCYPK